MYSYIARRLIFGVLTVIGVSIMVFVIMRILPGDPLVAILGPEGLTKLTEEQRANYMAELGLSDPLWTQYLRWIGDIVHGRRWWRRRGRDPVCRERHADNAELRHQCRRRHGRLGR